MFTKNVTKKQLLLVANILIGVPFILIYIFALTAEVNPATGVIFGFLFQPFLYLLPILAVLNLVFIYKSFKKKRSSSLLIPLAVSVFYLFLTIPGFIGIIGYSILNSIEEREEIPRLTQEQALGLVNSCKINNIVWEDEWRNPIYLWEYKGNFNQAYRTSANNFIQLRDSAIANMGKCKEYVYIVVRDDKKKKELLPPMYISLEVAKHLITQRKCGESWYYDDGDFDSALYGEPQGPPSEIILYRADPDGITHILFAKGNANSVLMPLVDAANEKCLKLHIEHNGDYTPQLWM